MRVGIIGHFGKNKVFNDGQTVKTKNLYNALSSKYGKEEIMIIDTYNWKKNVFSLIINTFKMIKNCDNIICLPARNGIKLFIPMLTMLNKFYNKNLIYDVIGGWLPDILIKNKFLKNRIVHFNYVLVEVDGMKQKLKQIGVDNVVVIPNFKNIKILNDSNLVYSKNIKFCTFSRVLKEKGIPNAIEVIEKLNRNKMNCTLDIYGQIDSSYEEEFKKILKSCSKNINYKGVVDSNCSVDIIKEYTALLFPTYYDGEGLAGTLIDCLSSGVPAVVSDWKYNSEIIKNQYNGWIFDTKNDMQMYNILKDIIDSKYDLKQMKLNALESALQYEKKNVLELILKILR